MDRKPTHEDADLILRLFELRREPRLREARKWFIGSFHARTLEEYQRLCPPGSEENASYRMLISYWDMAASFVRHGILHPEVFFESSQEMLIVWERVRDFVPQARETYRNPYMLRNIEEVAAAFQQWWSERAPEFYPLFSNMMRSQGAPAAPAGKTADSD